MAGGDVIANCDVDIMAGDKVIISCSGGLYPEEEGDTLVSWHSDGTNLTVPFLISDTEAVTLTYYLDQESEYYKKIAIRRGIESDPAKSYAGNIGLWVPADDNLVTSLVPIRLGRCDRWQLKFEGSGYVTIRGIQREFVTGSER